MCASVSRSGPGVLQCKGGCSWRALLPQVNENFMFCVPGEGLAEGEVFLEADAMPADFKACRNSPRHYVASKSVL